MISSLPQPLQPINRSSIPTPITFAPPETPSMWVSAANNTSWENDTSMLDNNNNNQNTDYEENVKDDGTNSEYSV